MEIWGTVTTDSKGGADISFPTSFTTTDYSVSTSQGYTSSPAASGYKASTLAVDSLHIGGSSSSAYPIKWKVIGY